MKEKKIKEIIFIRFWNSQKDFKYCWVFFLSKELKKNFLVSGSAYCCHILQTTQPTNPDSISSWCEEPKHEANTPEKEIWGCFMKFK